MFEYNRDQQCLWLKAPIAPVPQGRPRFSRRRGRTRARTPIKSRLFKNELADLATILALKHQVTPLEGPLAVFAHFILTKPPSAIRKRSNKRPYPMVKPDLDNYAKAVLDALNGVFWGDDGQITSLHLQKHYGEPGEEPGIEIVVEPAGWHMHRLQHRESYLGRIAQPNAEPVSAMRRELVKQEKVGFEINFSERDSNESHGR